MMDLTLLAYPFLFAAIYFEAFLLVTFLSKPARDMRERAASTKTPTVAMIVPCYNEGETVRGTTDSLLALDYPKDRLQIILVNDGSTDSTKEVMDSYKNHPQVTVIHKENGGKHTALNAGIAATDAEIFGCLDADSFVEKNALREMISCFDAPEVAAATAAMSVHKPTNVLERMQNAEYIMGIALRHILASVNGIYVTPGPFSLYRRSVIEKVGGFRRGHNTEDMEMALRIQKAGYTIESAPRALVFTKTPKTVPALVKQRVRWTTGFLRNMLYDYRELIGNPRYGALGTIVLPLGFFAIVGGLLMFGIVIYQLGYNLVQALIVTSGVPLSYTLANLIPNFSHFEWFYIPLTFFALLSTVALLGSIAFILVGRTISKTPGSLGIAILGWMLLYGLVAPLWLLGSVADVAAGTKRSWR
ncbi:MAG TPA: glycosyltransferase family 2 protein [Candidatus Paceibacterota bacterium]|nr:glycosyltransferase family 2 protein [Candidatus Paceibacterota bacterium]